MQLGRRIERLLTVGWQASGEPSPRLYPGDRRQIARRAREAAEAVLGREPRGPAEMARALGVRVHCLPVQGCGGEGADGHRIIYRWSNSTEVRRRRVAHGLAHALLVREGWEHAETDALLLTVDLL